MANKTSICIIGVYFGKLPAYFNLWLQSCERNADTDFLVVTDNKLTDLPNNVKCVNMLFKEFKSLVDEKLGFETALTTPYKCCDFKVVYGIVLSDYLKTYDFWGHCDFDLIFGNIRTFITEEILEKYDKVLPLGHLSLYRNTPECNNRYKESGSRIGDYVKVYTNPQNVAFDEMRGIYQIYLKNDFPMYSQRPFADIATTYKRFRTSEKNNYKYQAFYWEDGRVYRSGYKKNKESFTEEYVYIHFQKRGFNNTVESDQSAFYICPDGFVKKNHSHIPIIDDIKKVNPYNAIKEFCSTVKKEWKYTIVPGVLRFAVKIRNRLIKK